MYAVKILYKLFEYICAQVQVVASDVSVRERRLQARVRQAHVQTDDGNAGGVFQTARTTLQFLRPREERAHFLEREPSPRTQHAV